MKKSLADLAVGLRGKTFDAIWNPYKNEPHLGISNLWYFTIERNRDREHTFFLNIPFEDGSSVQWKIDSMTFNNTWQRIS